MTLHLKDQFAVTRHCKNQPNYSSLSPHVQVLQNFTIYSSLAIAQIILTYQMHLVTAQCCTS